MAEGVARQAVSVIVPFAGTVDDARSMLAALSRLAVSDGDELIVADNTGEGVAPAALADLDGALVARVVPADVERSSYHARNVAAEHAANEWLCFLDAD